MMHADSSSYTTGKSANELKTKAELSLRNGLPEHKIFVFASGESEQAVNNIELIQVTSLGLMGRNRAKGRERGKSALVNDLKRLDLTHKHFDHQQYTLQTCLHAA